MTLAVHVENLGKKYKIGTAPQNRGGYNTLRDTLANTFSRQKRLEAKGPDNIIWAVRNISFDVEEGQVLGIIGHNGAGKSTLLKLLSRVVEPTEGMMQLRGRVGSLLEVGTGFHPELTGRENLYLNGAILGMHRSEIDRKFDEIVDFSEVEKFIDTPVKRYSSGMYLRLAFAVAAHLEPEILVVDEVLAVGDAEFQRKCLGKMNDVAEAGRTVLFVSHNMSAVLRLTDESIVLEKGRMIMRAPSAEAVDYYLSAGHARAGEKVWDAEDVPPTATPFKPRAIRIVDNRGNVVETIRSTESFQIEFEYDLSAPITGLRVGIYLYTARGEPVFTSFDTDDPRMFNTYTERAAGHYLSRCVIPPDLLNTGRYTLGVNASAYRIRRYFAEERTLEFNVDPAGAPGMHWSEPRPGAIRPRLDWKIEKLDK
jgi:lipopolysaccharide transport system ATP-binding protein